jgi:hypothetical protein
MGRFSKSIYRVISIIPLTILMVSGRVDADSLQIIANFSGNKITSPASLPEKQKMKLVGFFTITRAGQIAGGMAVCDDVATKRLGDYAEIYNPTGALLAIIWFDKFGILRFTLIALAV